MIAMGGLLTLTSLALAGDALSLEMLKYLGSGNEVEGHWYDLVSFAVESGDLEADTADRPSGMEVGDVE